MVAALTLDPQNYFLLLLFIQTICFHLVWHWTKLVQSFCMLGFLSCTSFSLILQYRSGVPNHTVIVQNNVSEPSKSNQLVHQQNIVDDQLTIRVITQAIKQNIWYILRICCFLYACHLYKCHVLGIWTVEILTSFTNCYQEQKILNTDTLKNRGKLFKLFHSYIILSHYIGVNWRSSQDTYGKQNAHAYKG